MADLGELYPLLIRLKRTGEEKVIRSAGELPKGGYTLIKTRYSGKVAEHAR
jgi:hypothetical protein